MAKPIRVEFSTDRWACPHCNYSVHPDMHSSERKHFDAHALQCVRCLYRTETKASWAEAEAAYRRTPPLASHQLGTENG